MPADGSALLSGGEAETSTTMPSAPSLQALRGVEGAGADGSGCDVKTKLAQ